MLRIVIASLLFTAAMAVTQCSSGQQGQPCGESQRLCPPEEASCQNGKCECNTGNGQNELLCVGQNDLFTSVYNDPQVRPFGAAQDWNIPVPCVYLLTHVETQSSLANFPGGKCDVKIYAKNRRYKGKMFVTGFRVVIRGLNMGRFSGKKVTFKVEGEGSGGQYCFNMEGKVNNGAWKDPTGNEFRLGAVPHQLALDPHTNRVKLNYRACGITVQFRPPVKELGKDQNMLPGVAVKIDGDANPSFKTNAKTVALKPGVTPGTDDVSGMADNIYRSLTSDSPQGGFEGNSQYCAAAKDAFDDCPNKDAGLAAAAKCMHLLESPLLVNCYSKEGGTPDAEGDSDRIMQIFNMCISAECNQDSASCEMVKNALNDLSTNCKSKVKASALTDSCDYSANQPLNNPLEV